ncbi:MAG: hypothetical protein JXA73_08510 [Acidobacteria bacterium]|nr:hypothetical protein [Acidobacteriota bacterium]
MRTVLANELPLIAEQIASRINECGMQVDIVVWIESGGRLLGQMLGDCLGVPVVGVSVSKRKSRYRSALIPIFRWAPRGILSMARWLDVALRTRKERALYVSGTLPPYAQCILVVDDAVDSGNTLKAVVNWCKGILGDGGLVRSAVITTTSSCPAFSPDISLYNEICSFPWSLASFPGEKPIQ